ncbi:hypothetical protein RMCBS344292_15599 [Rhizopus microsporus]|nr:hypothetical protein RMCBS344292_15599 [Rhizopus microsporus]
MYKHPFFPLFFFFSFMDRLLSQFQFERVLSNDPRTKQIYVLGYVDNQHCILSFEKTPFEDNQVNTLAQTLVDIDQHVENHIYSWGIGQLPKSDLHIKSIYPATDLHIAKYEAQTRVMIVETPTDYERITLPYIKDIPLSRIQWVKNILEGKSEADRVIYQNKDPQTGFVILPDMKWDGSQENLYWVAIAQADILSLRSLTRDHLPLLKKIRQVSYELVKEKAQLEAHQVRLFVHYQPSYYHFHVHITAITFIDAPGIMSGQAHLLDTVIDNIEHYPQYYQLASIPFLIGENHPLTEKYKHRH